MATTGRARVPLSVITNQVSSAFVVDKAKLTRIVTILADRYQRAGIKADGKFEIRLKSGKNIILTTLEEVFGLDNSVKNPITSLEVTYRSISEVDLNSHVSFDEDCISVEVRGSDSALAQEVAAELEEQVDRIKIVHWLPKGSGALRWLAFALVAVGGTLQLLAVVAMQSRDVTPKSIRLLAPNPGTEEKINFIYEFTRQQVESTRSADRGTNFAALLTIPNFCIALPFVLIIGCLIYMSLVCYPRHVFAWGDWEEHYNRLVSRRKTLWTVVVLALLLGIVSSLFASAIWRHVA